MPKRKLPKRGQIGEVYILHLDKPIGHARHYVGWSLDAAERLVGRKSSHGVNAVADLLFCTLLCDDMKRAAVFSARFARVKVLHEAPRRVRSRLSS